MITDLFHIYPTDGYVNGQRSNYSYGEVSNANWTSTNGSKVGYCSYPGYSGIVFEPIDEYKGDFARTYFYMLTRYMDQVSSWNCDMLDGGDLAAWAKEMLLEWDENDPVSDKETDRNEAVFQIQFNRNPFIDHPEYQGLIWENNVGIGERDPAGIMVRISGHILYADWKDKVIQQITITNILGQQVYSFNTDQSRIEKELNLNTGLYIVKIFGYSDCFTSKILFLIDIQCAKL